MKLIRLTSENDNGRFDNQFNTNDLILKKGDQIALQSASFSNQINTIDISAANDEVKFQISAGNEKVINVLNNLYTNENVNDLLDDIELKFNNSVGLVQGKELGTQFVAEVNPRDDKVDIGYFRAPLSGVKEINDAGYAVFKNSEFVSNQLSSATGQAARADDRNKFFQTVPFGFGSKVMRCKIFNFNDNGSGLQDNGFIFGLSEVNPAEFEDLDDMTDDQKTYYIRFNRNGEDYKSKVKGGVEVNSTLAPLKTTGSSVDNDHLEICINQGKLQGRIYQTGPDSTNLLFDVDYDNNTVLYPFIILRGAKTDVRLHSVIIQHNSFILFNNNMTAIEASPDQADTGGLTTNKPPSGAGAVLTVNKLTLHQSLADFFGFDNDINQATLGNQAIFKGNNIFRATLTNTSFIVELNLKINSYNSAEGVRENILSVIPSVGDRDLDIIEYEPANLYFIDVLQDLNLRQIKARILRIDGSEPLLRGLSVLTLLVKSKDE